MPRPGPAACVTSPSTRDFADGIMWRVLRWGGAPGQPVSPVRERQRVRVRDEPRRVGCSKLPASGPHTHTASGVVWPFHRQRVLLRGSGVYTAGGRCSDVAPSSCGRCPDQPSPDSVIWRLHSSSGCRCETEPCALMQDTDEHVPGGEHTLGRACATWWARESQSASLWPVPTQAPPTLPPGLSLRREPLGH